MANKIMVIAIIALAFLVGIAKSDDDKKPLKIEFTKEEAKFLAYLASQEKQVDFMKALLNVADAVDFPTGRVDLAEYFVKKTVEAVLESPSIDKALANLDKIKCLKSAEDIQLFLAGKHPEVKGTASAKNKKFFVALSSCYTKNK